MKVDLRTPHLHANCKKTRACSRALQSCLEAQPSPARGLHCLHSYPFILAERQTPCCTPCGEQCAGLRRRAWAVVAWCAPGPDTARDPHRAHARSVAAPPLGRKRLDCSSLRSSPQSCELAAPCAVSSSGRRRSSGCKCGGSASDKICASACRRLARHKRSRDHRRVNKHSSRVAGRRTRHQCAADMARLAAGCARTAHGIQNGRSVFAEHTCNVRRQQNCAHWRGRASGEAPCVVADVQAHKRHLVGPLQADGNRVFAAAAHRNDAAWRAAICMHPAHRLQATWAHKSTGTVAGGRVHYVVS